MSIISLNKKKIIQSFSAEIIIIIEDSSEKSERQVKF